MSGNDDGSSSGDGGARPAGALSALPVAGLRLAAALASRPSLLVRRAGGWAWELGRVGLGRSALAPEPAAPFCTGLVGRRAAQVFLATTDALSGLLDDAADGAGCPLPADDAARLRSTLHELTTLLVPGAVRPAVPPSATGAAPVGVTPVPEPSSVDPTSEDGGPPRGQQDTAPGTGHADPAPGSPGAPRDPGAPGAPDDPAAPAGPGTVEQVFTAPGPGDPGVPFDTGARDTGAGPVRGRDVAATPGAVVQRTPMFELLQYLPVTEQVHDTPVLVVPPLLHRYWLADLAPGYSLVEHLVAQGLQVFALSWRPPGPADAGRDLDAHAAAVLDALEACLRIARAPRVSLLGVRSGGLLSAAVQAHQAAIGLDDRVAAAGYVATVLDGSGEPDRTDGPPGTRPGPAAAPGTGRVLPWPGTGTDPHARASRAVRAWDADLLPLPSSLRADLAAVADDTDTGLRVLGTPVHPAVLRRDGYLVAAADDPGQSWTDGYLTARLLGGACRLVLAPGDRAGVVLAPPRAATSFRAASCGAGDDEAEAWLAAADHVEGSWWDDLAGWLADRSGTLRDAPPELGGRRLPPLFPAPGTYLTAEPGVPTAT